MSKTIYYIGAGASYGRYEAREVLNKGTENERLIIHEGLPIVSEITKSLLTFKKAVEEASIGNENLNVPINNNGYQNVKMDEIVCLQKKLIKEIEDLYKATKEHATIDTYAKKLFLTGQAKELQHLKNILSVFFLWIQLEGKIDQRYDTFLANILQKDILYIPKDISIISWNYDSQLEIAYRYYNVNGSLPIYEKNVDKNIPSSNDYGKIFKVNGSANICDRNLVHSIFCHEDVIPIIQLIYYYDKMDAETSQMGYKFRSHLSFAWETPDKQELLMEAIKQATLDTESIVVIGYSFPYFNREIDRAIFVGMPNLKTIYIQDPYPDAVEQSLKAVLPEGSKVKIEHQKDCTQFYLPREL